MLLTTVLLYRAMRDCWKWSAVVALGLVGLFLVVDAAFFAANLMKILEGGWIPLVFGALLFTIMTTWRFGIEAGRRKLAARTEPLETFLKRLHEGGVPRVPGTAVFLTRTQRAAPPLITEHLRQMGALHETLIALTTVFEEIPRVPPDQRLTIEDLGENVWRFTVRYGFVEVPDLPAALREGKAQGCPIDLGKAVYFGARDAVVCCRPDPLLSRWQVPIFSFMYRNAVHAVDRFNLPPASFIEIGRQVEV